MNASLAEESERLVRCWMRHEQAMLRDYLVAGVEDPRVNLQSVFTRHFLVRAFAGEQFTALMDQEYRFAAVMNWLTHFSSRLRVPEELEALLYALRHGADNAEGEAIPRFVVKTFAMLPASAGSLTVPNYIESFLAGMEFVEGQAKSAAASLDTFQQLWRTTLAGLQPGTGRPKVIEPACGSANDYRFLDSYGLAGFLDYRGFDLCVKNVENARNLFPRARFEEGNVFEIDVPDKAVDYCFVHDLFEHLSLDGLQTAVSEVCRVTRRGLCVGFFNLDEIPEHIERPVDEYHWNTLSLERMKELFERNGFVARTVHHGSFLRQHVGCEHTHNPNAHTFVLEAA